MAIAGRQNKPYHRPIVAGVVVVVVVVALVVAVVVVAGVAVVVAGVAVVVAGTAVAVAFVVVVAVVAGMAVVVAAVVVAVVVVAVVVAIVVEAGMFEQRLNAFQPMAPQQTSTVGCGASHGSLLLAVQGASPRQSATHLRFAYFVSTRATKMKMSREGSGRRARKNSEAEGATRDSHAAVLRPIDVPDRGGRVRRGLPRGRRGRSGRGGLRSASGTREISMREGAKESDIAGRLIRDAVSLLPLPSEPPSASSRATGSVRPTSVGPRMAAIERSEREKFP
jgi:hypothetical protein